MYGFKTGDDMDKFLGNAIKNVDVSLFGSYDKDTDDVTFTLCPRNCGGPLIGHIDDQDDDCIRDTSTQHDPLTDAETKSLIDTIKALSNWNKAKLLWITDPVSCTCDMCQKKSISMFHLYDHMATEHKIKETMIKTKIQAIRSKIVVPNTLEEAIKLLVASQSQNNLTQTMFMAQMAKSETKTGVHVQKPQFVPEWTKYQKYEIFKENLSNWDDEHTSLSNSNKFGKVMMSLTKNKEIANLSQLASGKISETLLKPDDKTVPKIIELLDEKYLQTKSERFESAANDLQSFKLTSEDSAEASWDKFSALRSMLMKENLISDLFLHTIFFNACVKLGKLARAEARSLRDILKIKNDDEIHTAFVTYRFR